MVTGLIGHTGFIGSNLAAQRPYDLLVNSKNSSDLVGRSFDELTCAGISAVKWLANKEPAKDWENIQRLMETLSTVRARRFNLISTIDVYSQKVAIYEDSPIDEDRLCHYGLHRLRFEKFCQETFNRVLVFRLSGVFGPGLKKNVVHDLMHGHEVGKIHFEEVHQYYDVSALSRHMEIAVQNDIRVLNLSSEPIGTRELAREVFGLDFDCSPDKTPAKYDMRTRYGRVLGGTGDYAQSKDETIRLLRSFVSEEKARKTC